MMANGTDKKRIRRSTNRDGPLGSSIAVQGVVGICLSVLWPAFLTALTAAQCVDARDASLELSESGDCSEPIGPSIPHVMFFTHKENILERRVPQLLYDNVIHTVDRYRTSWGEPDAEVVFLDDEDCLEKISEAEPRLLEHFRNEKKGAYKADICRVAALYLRGGYYFDTDIRVVEPVRLEMDVSFATVRESKPRKDGKTNFFQAFLASSRKHPILEEALRTMLAYYEGRHKLHGWMGVSTLGDAFEATDPLKRGVVRIFRERNNVEGHDEYYPDLPRQIGIGCCCNYIVHDEDERLIYFYSRIVGAGSFCMKGNPSSDGESIALKNVVIRNSNGKKNSVRIEITKGEERSVVR